MYKVVGIEWNFLLKKHYAVTISEIITYLSTPCYIRRFHLRGTTMSIKQ